MTQIIIYKCDICTSEFPPKSYGFFTGKMFKVDEELKEHNLPFEGHYCGECTELIIKHIDQLKNEARGTNIKAEQRSESNTGSK